MSPSEALDKLVGLARYMEDSIPDYMWSEWHSYADEHGEEFVGDINIEECAAVLYAALAQKS